MNINAIINEIIPEIRNAKNSDQVNQIISSSYFSIPNSSDKIEFIEKLTSKIQIIDEQQNEQALNNIRIAKKLIKELLGR